MGELIKHECGLALIRLKKDLQFYEQKYGSALYGFNKLFLLMEKQHNRGQDGAGIGCAKLNMPLGKAYLFRERTLEDDSLERLFGREMARFERLVGSGAIMPAYAPSVKEHFDFGGEVLIGHLRYGTSGAFDRSSCHPYFRRSNWPTRNLMILGNFNMTNTAELNRRLTDRGQHPIYETDTQTVLEEIGFHLDEAHQELYHQYRDAGLSGKEIQSRISANLDLPAILHESASIWDGGYAIVGLVGNGDSFVIRDPRGIRPAYYFEDDEIVAVASERVALMSVFDKSRESIQAVRPGHVLLVSHDTTVREAPFHDPLPPASCSFERIYFSRGNDPEIYEERMRLGGTLCDQILEAIDNNLVDTVFSFVPNTAEIAYYGLLRRLREIRRDAVKAAVLEAQKNGPLSEALIDNLIIGNWPRSEKIAHKDIKLRTFISQEVGRSKLVSHVYDITYGVLEPKDTLVVLDDSIVRGTTMRESTLRILSRTNPKKIIIVSTAPQIRYPDCYGIDMSEIGKFVAFQAAVALLKESGRDYVLRDIYSACIREVAKPRAEQINLVRGVYEPFEPEEIAARIAELVRPPDLEWQGEIEIIFQTIENLHQAIPDHSGDWYFTGHYPTPGGTAVANQAFIHYHEKRDGRSY